MIGVWQTYKRNPFIVPVLLERRQRIRTDSQNLHAAAHELIVSITQARQLRAAVWSLKAAQECEYDWLAPKIG